jgi:hypothetical protein
MFPRSINPDSKDLNGVCAKMRVDNGLPFIATPWADHKPGAITCFRVSVFDMHLVKLSTLNALAPVLCYQPKFKRLRASFYLVEILPFNRQVKNSRHRRVSLIIFMGMASIIDGEPSPFRYPDFTAGLVNDQNAAFMVKIMVW